MRQSGSSFYKLAVLAGVMLGLSGCMTDRTGTYPGPDHGTPNNVNINRATGNRPSYSNNGSYDDNGAEPAPNNGNQNFGRRW